jgi:hypothetical protein
LFFFVVREGDINTRTTSTDRPFSRLSPQGNYILFAYIWSNKKREVHGIFYKKGVILKENFNDKIITKKSKGEEG